MKDSPVFSDDNILLLLFLLAICVFDLLISHIKDFIQIINLNGEYP